MTDEKTGVCFKKCVNFTQGVKNQETVPTIGQLRIQPPTISK